MEINARYPIIAILAACLTSMGGQPASSQRSAGKAVPPPSHQPWCAFDELHQRQLATDPEARAREEEFEVQLQRSLSRKNKVKAVEALLTVPVVVHVVYLPGTTLGTAENISDNQILSQIEALNRDFRNSPASPAPATDTRIQFCLAQNPPPGSGIVWPGTPGITRTASSLSFNSGGGEEVLLKALIDFPRQYYLNVWVVATCDGATGGIAGYTRAGGFSPPAIDGIVIRSDAFGSNHVSFGSSFTLHPGSDDGKILTHEVGHYFHLYHPWGSFFVGCSPPGDYVLDTPPVASPNYDCPSGTNSCTNDYPVDVNDQIENFMDYTSDACRTAFTEGQTARMRFDLLAYCASLLDSPAGCGSDVGFSVSATSVCPGGTVTFSTNTEASTYAWSFPGGNPPSATGPGPHTVTYAAEGGYAVSLTVDAGTPDEKTRLVPDYVFACCPPVNPNQAYWYFGARAALHFTDTGPVPVAGSVMNTDYGCTTQSDGLGNLLFYASPSSVFDRNHQLMNPGTPLAGGGLYTQSIIPVPDPGNSTRYYLFSCGNGSGTFVYSIIDFTNNPNGTITSINVPIGIPPSSSASGQITAVRHCNRRDYWVIVSTGSDLLVYLLNSSGLSPYAAYPAGLVGQFNWVGYLKAAPDGRHLAYAARFAGLILYDFDPGTGVISNARAVGGGNSYQTLWYGIAFSPSSKVLYAHVVDWATFDERHVYQFDITAWNPSNTRKDVAFYRDEAYSEELALGPDGKVYLSSSFSIDELHLSVINFPDRLNTSSEPNACGFQRVGPSLTNSEGYGFSNAGLPNMIDALPTADPDFYVEYTSCNTIQFHLASCAATTLWEFGDGTSSTSTDPSHTFTPGQTYNVTLHADGAPLTKSVKVGFLPGELKPISGPVNTCDQHNGTFPSLTYSVESAPGYAYSWTVSGGVPASMGGPAVDVTWDDVDCGQGFITLTTQDLYTGCEATQTLTVVSCGGLQILTEPSDVTVMVGDEATFTVGVPPQLPGYEYTFHWYNDTKKIGLNDGPGISGTTTNTLVLDPTVAGQKNNLYSCQIDNTCGTIFSRKARLKFTKAVVDPDPRTFTSVAFPNPFNPETTIKFSIPDRSLVSLTIYDVAGRLVKVLTSESLPAGEHTRHWNGRDDSGHPVASGVYFYKFSANERSQTRKLILLK